MACVVTLGNFDGVHLGHQALLNKLMHQARQLQAAPVLILFEPHPAEFFLAEKAPARLMCLREKRQVLQAWSLAQILCLQFNRHLAHCSARTFVQRWLVEALQAKSVIVGEDFRFGRHRRGDVALLRKLGKQYGFRVVIVPALVESSTVRSGFSQHHLTSEKVSSSQVRAALLVHDFERAARLLGRPFCVSGYVQPGQQRGSTLGFPTANISLDRIVSPVKGVFAVRVHGVDAQPLPAVANIGYHPTVGCAPQPVLEVHLLDFKATLYGHHLQVEFLAKLRDEQHFSTIEALKQQIAQDIAAASALFSR